MKLVLVILSVCIAFVVSQPTLSDDFTASVELIEHRGHHRTRFNATLYEDFTDQLQRVDSMTHHPKTETIELLRIISSKKEYEILGGENCRSHEDDRSMGAAFDWVKKKLYQRPKSLPCSFRFSSWNCWRIMDKKRKRI